jgi:hypothetical protein
VRTFVLARDEATNTGRLGCLIKSEGFEKCIPLVFAHDRSECPPDVVPGWVIWFVIKVLVNSFTKLLIFSPRRNWFIGSW